jgi:hypothetical protein
VDSEQGRKLVQGLHCCRLPILVVDDTRVVIIYFTKAGGKDIGDILNAPRGQNVIDGSSYVVRMDRIIVECRISRGGILYGTTARWQSRTVSRGHHVSLISCERVPGEGNVAVLYIKQQVKQQ